MVDIETVGELVLSVGIVLFDTLGPRDGTECELRIDLEEQIELGLRPDAAELEFWLEQESRPWRAETYVSSIADAAKRINLTLGNTAENWANSPQFDFARISRVFAARELATEWHFRTERDFRTLRALYRAAPNAAPINIPPVPHSALDDAILQARQAAAMLRHLATGATGPELEP